jgi:hypothetical protein
LPIGDEKAFITENMEYFEPQGTLGRRCLTKLENFKLTWISARYDGVLSLCQLAVNIPYLYVANADWLYSFIYPLDPSMKLIFPAQALRNE